MNTAILFTLVGVGLIFISFILALVNMGLNFIAKSPSNDRMFNLHLLAMGGIATGGFLAAISFGAFLFQKFHLL